MFISSSYLADNISTIIYNGSVFDAKLNILNILIIVIGILTSLYLYKRKGYFSKSIIILTILILISPIRTRHQMEWFRHANWVFIILYLMLLKKFLSDKFLISYAIFTGIIFIILLFTNSYHGVETFSISIPIVIFSILSNKDFKLSKGKFIKLGVFATFIILGIITQYYIYNQSEGTGISVITSATRSLSDRWAFSARPWHYFIPDIDHPVLGDLATKVHYWIWQHPPYYLTEPFFPKEHTLFLGYTLTILSVLTIWLTYFKKKITEEKRFTVTFFLIITVTAFIFSMPPYIAINNFKIYFPSHFIYEVLPQFRAYARYGVLVFIGNTVLAMIGFEYIISNSFINKTHQKFKQNLLAILISVIAIFEFIPGKHLISTKPLPPYSWLQEQSKIQETPIKYMEIPERADYTDHLYTYGYNIKILNPYLITRGDAKSFEDMITKNEENDNKFCQLAKNLEAKYIFYHEKELNKQKVVDEFMHTKVVTPQLKVAMAESWGSPVFGNHVPKTDADLYKEQLSKDLKNILLNDPKLTLIKEYTNNEIIESRPNKNFSADKFDAITIFEINQEYCNLIENQQLINTTY